MKTITLQIPHYTGFALGMILGVIFTSGLIVLTAKLGRDADSKPLSVVVTFQPDQSPTPAPTDNTDSTGIQAIQAHTRHTFTTHQ